MDVALFMARVAEQGDRFEDMFLFLKESFQRR
jgi:14-3-3 protein epsilon